MAIEVLKESGAAQTWAWTGPTSELHTSSFPAAAIGVCVEIAAARGADCLWC